MNDRGTSKGHNALKPQEPYLLYPKAYVGDFEFGIFSSLNRNIELKVTTLAQGVTARVPQNEGARPDVVCYGKSFEIRRFVKQS